ncbi:MAG: DUF4097 domain-containing protein [Lachnospiraceae bacterium]|nr:DUF4097 domain-containing protein [Lachnospiraceae bacterium]
MNKLMKICFILMACGAVFVSVGVLMGGKLVFSYSFGGKVQTEPAEECKMLTEETKPFTNIELEVEDFSIEVAAGDGYAVTYPEGDADMDTDASVQGETLKLTQKYKKQFHFFHFDTLGIGRIGFLASNKENAAEKQKIIVTVPEGTALGKIQVKQNMGLLTLKDLQAEDIELDMDYGSLTIQDVKAGSFALKNDYGDVVANNVAFEKTELALSYGDADIRDGSLGEAVCSLACGDMSLHDVNGTSAQIKMDYGSFAVYTVQFESLRAVLSAGNMELKQYTGEQVELEMNYGSLKAEEVDVSVFTAALNDGNADLVFAGELDAYAMDLSCDDGKILVDGQKQGSEYHCKGNGSGKTVSVDADYGNISVDFAR